jgi:transcriptional regulator with XRE-family HTH domain
MGKRVRDLQAPEYVQAHKIVTEIDNLRLGQDMSQGQLNKITGYSQSGLSEWLSFKMPNYALVTLIRIAAGLGYDTIVTFVKKEKRK